ncbi:MAG: hypothetical protein LBT97_03235 [Planctomycetota bacterium]|jgi:hypothetical protein|nr:hypothetical protein [Planctomycetota bacterium]
MNINPVYKAAYDEVSDRGNELTYSTWSTVTDGVGPGVYLEVYNNVRIGCPPDKKVSMAALERRALISQVIDEEELV